MNTVVGVWNTLPLFIAGKVLKIFLAQYLCCVCGKKVRKKAVFVRQRALWQNRETPDTEDLEERRLPFLLIPCSEQFQYCHSREGYLRTCVLSDAVAVLLWSAGHLKGYILRAEYLSYPQKQQNPFGREDDLRESGRINSFFQVYWSVLLQRAAIWHIAASVPVICNGNNTQSKAWNSKCDVSVVLWYWNRNRFFPDGNIPGEYRSACRICGYGDSLYNWWNYFYCLWG